VKVTPKEATGNDNAVPAVTSMPRSVVMGGTVTTHRMKVKPANPAIKRIGGCFALTTRLRGAGRLPASVRLLQFDMAFFPNPNPAGPAQWMQTRDSR